MNTIAWNCQGAGAELTKEHLKELYRCFLPRFLFLSETKNNRLFLQDLQVLFGYDHVYTVEPVGRNGGLALFYMNDPKVYVTYSDQRMIDIETTFEGHRVYMTFVYGDPVVEYRELVWERLSRMSTTRQSAWLMIGDFNEITGNHEKRGGRRRQEASFLPFRHMLENCGMIDFPYKGNSFSWVGRRVCGKVKCRLDRAVGNEEWHYLFSHTIVEYLKLWGSDHRPVLAQTRSRNFKHKANFRLDKRWLGKPGFKEAVLDGWENPGRTIHQKISSCRRAISRWKHSLPTNTARLIQDLKRRIDLAQEAEETTVEELEDLRRQLTIAFRQEEIFWKQKSRVQWLREGDKNTKFFHASTKQRRARNKIICIKDRQGNLVESEKDIEEVANQYFQDLFTTVGPPHTAEALRFITEKVSDGNNRALLRDPSMEEIRLALFDINPDKAPGPDGMTSRLYQNFWPEMGNDITLLVKEFFRTGKFDPRLNETNICLIPKKDRPREMSEFRPISLCNVSYKIISKLLSKRLKATLPSLISETQSAFVARRLITDNILLAQENFHALRTNPMCKSKYMAIKTDMSKAYDRVEWGFLKALMLKLGFAERWVTLVMQCITSVSYKILLNGEAKGGITPTRGLRQGDPLSPFLFILCTEALIALLKAAEEEKRITGLSIARASPKISHLLFADDSLFFCEATVLQCAEIFKIINTYGEASGQLLNREKSSIIFGRQVEHSLRQDIKAICGISKEGGKGLYLGIPEEVDGSKQKVFAYIQDRLNNRINLWSARLLSSGGKEIQIKAVAQALPTYVMSCFLLPRALTNKLGSAISNFWWSKKQESRGLHWIAWDRICKPKEDGGLGFRDMRNFNLALLAKQLWRLIHFPSSLLAKVLRGRYYRDNEILKPKKYYLPSPGWRSIMAAKPLLEEGLRKTIGSGLNTKVWSESWIPDIPARPVRGNPNYRPRDPNLLVHNLIKRETNQWDVDLLRKLFHQDDIPKILGLRTSATFALDGYTWSHTKSGTYTVKSGYEVASKKQLPDSIKEVAEPSITPLLNQVWKAKTSGKLKHFMWNILAGCVSTCQRLKGRHLSRDDTCPRCGMEAETINHLIFECPPALQVWALSQYPSLPGFFPSGSLFNNMDYLFWRTKDFGLSELQKELYPWLIWYIWKARNDKIFNGQDISPMDTLLLASREAECWILANSPADQGPIGDPLSLSEGQNQDTELRGVRCQVDASWAALGKTSGLGWILKGHEELSLKGQRGCRLSLSALHAELDSLLWAMECLSERHIYSARFETDCMDLVKMVEKPEEWPSFRTELDLIASLRIRFEDFQVSHVNRALNIQADALAKTARAKNFCFISVVRLNQTEDLTLV